MTTNRQIEQQELSKMATETVRLVKYLVFECDGADNALLDRFRTSLSAGADPFMRVSYGDDNQMSPLEALQEVAKYVDNTAVDAPRAMKYWPLSEPKLKNSQVLDQITVFVEVLTLCLNTRPNNLNTMEQVFSNLVCDEDRDILKSFYKPIAWLQWNVCVVNKLVACAIATEPQDAYEQSRIETMVWRARLWLLDGLKASRPYVSADVTALMFEGSALARSYAEGQQQLIFAFKIVNKCLQQLRTVEVRELLADAVDIEGLAFMESLLELLINTVEFYSIARLNLKILVQLMKLVLNMVALETCTNFHDQIKEHICTQLDERCRARDTALWTEEAIMDVSALIALGRKPRQLEDAKFPPISPPESSPALPSDAPPSNAQPSNQPRVSVMILPRKRRKQEK